MLKNIKISNYRNLAEKAATFSPLGNILTGNNGIGKTNFVESIFYSVFGKAIRVTNNMEDFIGPEYSFATVTTEWDNAVFLEAAISKTSKNGISRKFSLNSKKVSVKTLPSQFPVLFFAPNTVDIINGEPVLRREEMDNFLSIIYPDYATELEKHKNFIKNKNAVLRLIFDNKAPRDSLNFWNTNIAVTGAKINEFRLAFISKVNESLKKSLEMAKFFYKDSSNIDVRIVFKPNIIAEQSLYKETLQNKMTENIEKEIIVKKSLYGPVKDDFFISVGNKDLRFFGSRGQQRIGAFLLKIAELEILQENKITSPLLILDDIMSELDVKNREKVGEYLFEQKIQFMLTSADPKEIPEVMRKRSEILEIFS